MSDEQVLNLLFKELCVMENDMWGMSFNEADTRLQSIWQELEQIPAETDQWHEIYDFLEDLEINNEGGR